MTMGVRAVQIWSSTNFGNLVVYRNRQVYMTTFAIFKNS